MRKTIPRDLLVATANSIIAHAETPAERQAVAALVESVLHLTNSYAGYNLRESEYLLPEEQTLHTVLRDGYDNTQRRYY